MRPRWLLAVLLLIPVHAAAFTLYPIPYSGQLTEGGVTVTGTRYFTFTLYDAPTGGLTVRVQSESLLVINGVYHTSLFTQPGDWSGGSRYLGVSVNSAPEMTPRVSIGLVPFAVHAVQSDTALVAGFSNWVSPAGLQSHYSGATIFSSSISWAPIDSMTLVVPKGGHVLAQAWGVWERFTVTSNVVYSLALSIAPPVTSDTGGETTTQQTVPYVIAKDLDLPSGTYTLHLWARTNAPGYTVIANPALMYCLVFPGSAP